MLRSRRKNNIQLFYGLLVVVWLILVAGLLLNNHLYKSIIVDKALKIALLLSVSILLINFVYLLIRYKGIRNYVDRNKLINSIENNLIYIGAYERKGDSFIAKLPKIKISDNEIKIYLNNLTIRKAIENSMSSFSTALPDKYIVDDYYLKNNSNELVIKYEDINNYVQESYSLYEYKNIIDKLKLTELYFDKKHVVDLLDRPHFLISGSTGSGKTFLTQQLLIQGLIKKYEIVVLDYKRSYTAFSKMIDYEYEPEKILDKLKQSEVEMIDRMDKLESRLETDPSALAIDVGYMPKLIIIEEYIGLYNAYDKKQAQELERIVKSIATLARSVNMNLIIVLQSANTENINSSIRHNLTKVLLGNAQSNILTATFGTGVDIPDTRLQLNKGEGLIQLDRIDRLKVPNVTYEISDLVEAIR